MLIASIDAFMPIVDDPYVFGQIAAANALSDVYAMGGTPLFALAFCGFPQGKLDLEILRKIMQGGADKAQEAGVVVAGGHTIDDDEPKYGLAVVGRAHPDEIVTNAGARIGDRLVLTKVLGSGIITTAARADVAPEGSLAQAIEQMLQLNRTAAQVAQEVGIHAGTDISGYGLLGHGLEMAEASGVRLQFYASKVRMMPAALELARQVIVPAGLVSNQEHVTPKTTVAAGVTGEVLRVLCDPQTSGGLLMAVEAGRANDLVERQRAAGEVAEIVGRVTEGDPGTLAVLA